MRASSRSFERCAAELGTGKTAPDVFSTVADLLLEEDLPDPVDFPIKDALPFEDDFPGDAMDFLDWLICLSLLLILDFIIPPKGFVLNGSSNFTAKGSLIGFKLVKE